MRKVGQTKRQDENLGFDLIRRERIGTAAQPLARRAKGMEPGVILPPQPCCEQPGYREWRLIGSHDRHYGALR
jgi:hypothetical protein